MNESLKVINKAKRESSIVIAKEEWKKKKIKTIKIYKFQTLRKIKTPNKNISFISLFYIFIIILIFPILSKETKIIISDNEISLKIKGDGRQQILDTSIQKPSRIYLNNVSQNDSDYYVNVLEDKINEIRIVWDSPIVNCYSMFSELKNITEVDLSKFNASKVTNMKKMFFNCSSLTSINLNISNISFVTNLDNMFFRCNSLEEIDLSYFNSKSIKNMYQMFYDCNSLTSIYFKNFDTSSVTNFAQTFFGLHKIKSLNLSNFNTTSASDMHQMFANCYELQNLDISSFNTKNVTNMREMFLYCKSLISLNLGVFNTSKVTNMYRIFYNCKSLNNLDLSNFDTSNINDMKQMFYNCNSLKSLDLSSFNTSKVINMTEAFYNCSSLEYLNISNFKTSEVVNMERMFYNCKALKSLDLSYFNTSNVQTMNGMFYDCNSLTFLELGNLDTSSVINMEKMFYNCISLVSLNLFSFDTTKIQSYNSMFYNLKDSLLYCINDNNTLDSVKSQISIYNKVNCSELCYNISKSKFIIEKNKCIIDCSMDDINIFEYDYICYKSCPKGTYTLDNNTCQKELNNETNSENIKNIETTNIISFSEIISDSIINSELNKPTISITKTNSEIIFNNDEISNTIFSNKLNPSITNYYNENVETINVINTNKNEFNNETTNNLEIISETNEFHELNNSKYSYEINSNLTELFDIYKSHTFIDFSQEIIEWIYIIFNLNKEKDKIQILIEEYISEDSRIATIDYNYRIFLKNGTELNLSLIEEQNYVDIYVPIENKDLANFNYSKYFQEQGYDIYNKSSDFYNDFCTSAYYNGNDITIEDRRKYIYPNISLCKNNCIYKKVDTKDERIICLCNINPKIKMKTEKDDLIIEDDGNLLSYLLDDINYKIFTCSQLIKSFDHLKNNYAFYTIIGLFFVVIILNLIFFFYSLFKIEKKMFNKAPNPDVVRKEELNEIKRFRNMENNALLNPTKKTDRKRIGKNINKSGRERSKANKIISKTNIPLILNIDNFNSSNNINVKRVISNSNISFDILLMNRKKEILNTEKYNDEELDKLPFALALILDKRTFLQSFYSLIIQKLELINLFYENTDVKLMIISEYILSLLINFFFNSLLYSDDVVSNKYHNNGKLDMIVSLFLSILSNIITSIICYYANYSKGIDERFELILEIKNRYHYLRNIIKLLIFLKKKFILFFLSEILIFFGCFYYIVIFFIIYSKSRGSLIINYLTSLLESLITGFVLTFIILATRKIGLVCKNKDLYNTSKFINNKF